MGATSSAEQPDPSNQERLDLLSDNHGSISYPGTEIRRDASLQYFSENDLFREDQSEDRLEPDWELMEEIMEQTEADTLADELVPAVSPPPQQHQQPTSVMSEQDLEFLNSDNVYSKFKIFKIIYFNDPNCFIKKSCCFLQLQAINHLH